MQLSNIWQNLKRFGIFVRNLGWRKLLLGALGLLIGIAIARFFFGTSIQPVVESNIPVVSVRSVSELSNQGSALSIAGIVSSQSQATVRTEASGAVSAVYRSLGDYVAAGTIVAELEDASARGALLQAQGGVNAAQANVDRVSIGVTTSKNSGVTSLLTAYASVDSAIHGSADSMILNPDSSSAQFTVPSSNSQAITKINATRPALVPIFVRESARANTLSPSDDLLAEISKTQGEIRQAQVFMDLIITALNTAIETPNVSRATIDADLASATAARASLNAALSGLSGAQGSLSTSASGDGSASSPEVAAALAGLEQAQGSLALARANLEKSIIRAPISGTINSFSLKRGDYVAQQSPVLTIANNNALEITAYATALDIANISPGKKVEIEGGNSGTVTHVAPAIDPQTKKIEVRIGVTDDSSLVNGQSVLVDFPRKTTAPTKVPSRITIPITAIKVGASEVVVFSVSSTTPLGMGTLMAHSIVLGELLGDSVAVASGLTPEMFIVVDARGLKDGDAVEIAH